MKRKVILMSIMIGGMLIIGLNSCVEDKNNKCGETKISRSNESESHNQGKNCMSCHVSGGEGEGCFITAGTVYQSSKTSTVSAGTVELYSEPNGGGTLVATLSVDKLGNFYSTNSVDFGSGLYPVVTSNTGQKKYMGSRTSTGACGSCHGGSQEVIWVP